MLEHTSIGGPSNLVTAQYARHTSPMRGKWYIRLGEPSAQTPKKNSSYFLGGVKKQAFDLKLCLLVQSYPIQFPSTSPGTLEKSSRFHCFNQPVSWWNMMKHDETTIFHRFFLSPVHGAPHLAPRPVRRGQPVRRLTSEARLKARKTIGNTLEIPWKYLGNLEKTLLLMGLSWLGYVGTWNQKNEESHSPIHIKHPSWFLDIKRKTRYRHTHTPKKQQLECCR